MSTAHLQGLGSLQLGYQVVPFAPHVVILLPQVAPVQLHLVELVLLLLNLPGVTSLQSVHHHNWYIERKMLWQKQMLLLHPHPLGPE